MIWIVFLVVLLLAYANGANDNFKGVATLYGSGAASFRTALGWATLTTLGGSLLALVLAAGLVKTFSAKGLVPDAVATSPQFLLAVALGTMTTVFLATLLGLPISTTHALTGALVGAGFVAVGRAVNLGVLGKSFFMPLLISPVLALGMTTLLYPLARWTRRALGVERTMCICVGEEWIPLGTPTAGGAAGALQQLSISVAAEPRCAARYQSRRLGSTVHQALDGLHFLSAGAVSFARGLNDTPKIFALLLAAKAASAQLGLMAVGLAMALGGLLNSRRVAETMAHKITALELGQGLVANLTTATLVIGASRLGLPVSTTHVSTGGLFGIGLITGSARWRTIALILVAWGTTLPLGALLGATSLLVLRAL